VAQTLASIGNEPDYQTPADFASHDRAAIERWAPIVKASGFVEN
jgi:tripartite-type tricarboxylate transporter receptor subunit TctC